MVNIANRDYFCSTLSLEAQEPLFGSAPEKTVWLLLEYTQPWGAKVFPESALAEPVKAHIAGYLDDNPAANILFIKQSGAQREGITFFVAVTDEQNPCLYEFTLDGYDELLSLDFTAIARGQSPEYVSGEPLFLVCTNTKRDKCCAKYGAGVYRELRQYAGSRAWQCSHIGGHRFAPTSLFFPQGICYGRIDPHNVEAMVAAHREGQITLDNLRGRVCYDSPSQAADYLLRAELGLTRIEDVRLAEIREIGTNQWAAQFRVNGENRDIRLEKVQTDVEIFTSCFNDKTAFVEAYRLA